MTYAISYWGAQEMLSKASHFPDPTPLLPTGVLAIRHTNDCVSNDSISGTLTLSYARGTVHISRDSEFFDFGDSAVAPVRSRGYFSLFGMRGVLLEQCWGVSDGL